MFVFHTLKEGRFSEESTLSFICG